jgi:hypothetical protein
VRLLEGLGHLPRDGEHVLERERPPLEPLGEVLPGHQLEDEERLAVRLVEAVDRGDVRVVEGGEEVGFAAEPREALLVAREVGRRTLIATSRPSFVSRARYTSPMPPAPTGARIS